MRSKVAKSRSSKNLRKSKNRVGSKRRTRSLGNRVGSKRKTKNYKNRRVSRSKRVKGGSAEAGEDFCEEQDAYEGLDPEKYNALIDFLLDKFTKERFSDNFKNIVKAFLKHKGKLLPCEKSSQIDGYSISSSYYYYFQKECQQIGINMKDILQDLLTGEDTFNNSKRLFYLAEYTDDLDKIAIKKKTNGSSFSEIKLEEDKKIKTIQAVKNDGTAQEVSVGESDAFFELLDYEAITVVGLDKKKKEKEYFIVKKSCTPK